MITTENRIMAELCFVQADAARKVNSYSVAEHWFTNALELDPENPLFLEASVYPIALQHKYSEAIERCTLAMKYLEGYPRDNLQYTRSLIYLNTNDYLRGFKDFEIRLKQRPIAAIHEKLSAVPYWEGEPCKTLYVFGEQGFGDILMFSRYLPLVKTKFNVEKIYFEVPKACAGLFKYNFRNDPEIEVISVRSTYELLGTDKEFQESDYYIQQLSLARLFETTFDTVPAIKIEAEPEYIEKFKYLSADNVIALCPGGRPENGDPAVNEWNNRRNVDKNYLENIVTNRGYNIVYLQQELNNSIETWSDTAGILANCKMAISIDSGPVHLCGAMGLETVLLNHYQSCWRWTLDKAYTPWYSTNLKIIRQKYEGDWRSVFDELEAHLGKNG